MIAIMTRLLILLALSVSLFASRSEAADALRTAERAINEYMLLSQIIISCHAVQTDADTAYIDTGKALGDATFEQLLAQFDAVDPTRHVDNVRQADETMQRLIVDAERRAESIIQGKGCAALENELKAPQ
jgi:hypothetical protein